MLHSFELYRAVAPLARRVGRRVLYDAHDFYRGIETPNGSLRSTVSAVNPFLRRLEDQLVSVADAFTTVSDGARRSDGSSIRPTARSHPQLP